MTRICEQFIEEITSGSGAVSAELTQHLASCSACREAFESIRQLKNVRKPLTGKEAAAIAGILKAVKSGVAASSVAAAGKSASSSSLALKSLLVFACALSIIAAMFLHAGASQQRDEKSAVDSAAVSAPDGEDKAIVNVDETENLTDNVKTDNPTLTATESGMAGDDTEVDIASSARTIFVAPDQENIEQR